MPPNETAQRNHHELFPEHVSTLARTDPELIEVFDNLAFDEVLRESALDSRTRVMLGAALTAGVTPVEAKEILYQAVPYVGMGRVFDFLHATNDVLNDRGVELPLPGQATTTPETRMQKGREVQAQIVGEDAVEQLYASAPADEQHIQRGRR